MFRTIIALTILTLLVGLSHYYVWKRFVHDPGLSRRWRGALTAATVLLAFAIPGAFLLRDILPRPAFTVFAWMTYTWMGFLFYLLVFGGIGDLLRLLREGASLFGARTPRDPRRRTFVARVFAGTVGAAALATGVTGLFQARRLRVKNVGVPLAKFPRPGNGYVIAQITDLHVGPTIGRAFVEEVVRTTNAVGADLIVITGDTVDGSVKKLRKLVAPLAGLRARDGVFTVTGNHEYYAGADEWIAHMAVLGIRTLRNERVDVRGLFDLAGVDDYRAAGMLPDHGQDVPRAVAGRDPGKPVVLLAHQPKTIHDAVAAGVDLQLSGHVHGGQMKPFNWLVHLDQPYLNGLHRVEDTTWLYVSEGTGYWGPPMRVGTTAEIARIELSSG